MFNRNISTCPRCGSGNILEHVGTKNAGCLSILCCGLLACIPVIGWIVLVYLLIGRRNKPIYHLTCRSCSKHWTVNPNQKRDLIISIIGVVVIILILASIFG